MVRTQATLLLQCAAIVMVESNSCSSAIGMVDPTSRLPFVKICDTCATFFCSPGDCACPAPALGINADGDYVCNANSTYHHGCVCCSVWPPPTALTTAAPPSPSSTSASPTPGAEPTAAPAAASGSASGPASAARAFLAGSTLGVSHWWWLVGSAAALGGCCCWCCCRDERRGKLRRARIRRQQLAAQVPHAAAPNHQGYMYVEMR